MLVLLITENNEIVFVIPALIIISREFLVISMRQRLAELRVQQKIKVLKISKFKTALQFISIYYCYINQMFLDIIFMH